MTDQPPRRRLQFRLRTLLIGVTLFAVACWIVIGDLQIKNRRKDFIESGAVIAVVINRDGGGVAFVIRRWLGDQWYTSVTLGGEATLEEVHNAAILFPEARV